MTQTKVHHAHPACSDTRWGIISQSGLSIPMCFIRRWLGPCTCCWTKSPRACHREPPPLWQPPLFLKQRHKGRNDRDRKEPPLAMLKQTHLEQGLDYCTRQGFFFFFSPPPPPHRVGKLLMTTGMETSWQGTCRDQREKDRGLIVQRRAPGRHILRVLLSEGYAWLVNPVALRLQAADILKKQNQSPACPSKWFQGRAVNNRTTNTTALELMCANRKQLLALGYHTWKSQKSNTVIPSACRACFTCSSWNDYKEEWRRKAHYHHFTDKETVAQKGSDLSCSPVEERGTQVKPLKSQSDALSPELLQLTLTLQELHICHYALHLDHEAGCLQSTALGSLARRGKSSHVPNQI